MKRLTDKQVEHRQTGKLRVKEAVKWALTIYKTENVQLLMLNGGHIFKTLKLPLTDQERLIYYNSMY